MKRTPIIIIGCFITVVLIVPSLIVLPFSDHPKANVSAVKAEGNAPKKKTQDPAITVSVYRDQLKRVDNLPLRDYLIGVVACEMPAEFDIEALKAQALAARTYIANRLLNKSSSSGKKAEVTDTQNDQVYKNRDELKKIWGSDYSWKIKKIEKAVDATENQVITYKGQLISPQFFSTSNGYTENSEDYWQNAIPYLKSVKSDWDENTPKFSYIEPIPVTKVEKNLGIQLNAKNGAVGKVLSRTAGKRVAKFEIGRKIFSGRTVREKLNLRSTDFKMKRSGDKIYVTTYGYGHGVGMSQYGANGMAADGKNYKDIVKYYYQGVDISTLTPFVDKMIVKK